MTKAVILKTEASISVAQSAKMLDGTNASELIAKFNEAKAIIKEMEARKAEAEAMLRDLMGDTEIGIIAGVERVKISSRTRKDINREVLATAFPEAYEASMQEKSYTVLTAVS